LCTEELSANIYNQILSQATFKSISLLYGLPLINQLDADFQMRDYPDSIVTHTHTHTSQSHPQVNENSVCAA